jgi:mono/diheme cytochrome c family protein
LADQEDQQVKAAVKHLSCGILLTALALGQLACSHPRRGEPFVGPLAPADSSVERGKIVFAQHCHHCHPGGEGGLGPGINDKPLPKFLMKTQVRVGLGVMPEFNEEQISDEDLDALVKYIVANRRHDEAIPGTLATRNK